MAYFETPDLPEPKAMPHYMVGAASPLWAYFATAAAGGVAFWWMTRWARPVNLEAMFAAAPAVEPLLEAAADAVEIVAEAPVAIVEALAEPIAAQEPVTEIAPDLAAASDAAVEAAPESRDPPAPETVPAPVIETAPEPVLEAAPEPASPAADVEPKPRVRRAAPPITPDEA